MREEGKGGKPLSSAILTKAKPQGPSGHPPPAQCFNLVFLGTWWGGGAQRR